eukprot:TRINITY_DN5270_c0_g1_i1.p1 TRINITY_DN5270_c0_g1~~TRINITY_DN5270_c0_g1_i1.p1  ORF type:complete len:693 (-),score=219.54 TRINITY_DN5270_c0_g1_i1:93-2171(-)
MIEEKKAFPEQLLEDELRELELIKPDVSETESTYKDLYTNIFTETVYQSYNKLQNFARELNTRIYYPEVIMIGSENSGKSELLNELVGHVVVGDYKLKRPLFFAFINNLNYDEPKITIKRDTFLKEYNHDSVVSITEIEEQLGKRNNKESDVAVMITYEHKNTLNLTYIDTPSMNDSKESHESLLKLIKPASRHIILVQSATDYENQNVIKLVKEADSDLTRTTIVFNGLYKQIRQFNSTQEINRYFSSTSGYETKVFHTSYIRPQLARECNGTDPYRKKIWQTQKRDLEILEQLQFDRTYENSIGLHPLRKFIIKTSWKRFQDDIPVILDNLRDQMQHAKSSSDDLENKLKSISSSNLRSLANTFVLEFLQIIDSLISGNSEGNPTVNGQSLLEEEYGNGYGKWKNSEEKEVDINPTKVSYFDCRLYGGQQFKRLLSVFKEVVVNTEMREISIDEVATAAGVNKINNLPNYTWAACELASQETKQTLTPLLKQLNKRSVYVAKRLPLIAKRILEGRKKSKWNTQPQLIREEIEQYPYFIYYIIELFEMFVEKQAQECTQKCLDEFLDTRTIYWNVSENENQKQQLPSENTEDKSPVISLSRNVFTKLRDTISNNSQLKWFNFFLVPLQTTLWSQIQESVNVLSEEDLQQKFEVNATKKRLEKRISFLKEEISRLEIQEKQLLESSTFFSYN